MTPEALQVHEAGKPARRWTLAFYPNGVRATPEGGGPDVHLLRAEAASAWRLVELPLQGAAIVMKAPRKVTWQLADDAFDRVARWLGYLPALRMALRNRLAWTLPLGLLLLVTSLPMPGDAAAGLDPIPFNPFTATLGALLLVQGLLSRFRLHRAFFALDAVWFVIAAADTLRLVASGARGPGWLVVLPFQLMLAFSGIRLFRRYDPGRPAWSAEPVRQAAAS